MSELGHKRSLGVILIHFTDSDQKRKCKSYASTRGGFSNCDFALVVIRSVQMHHVS